jgi:hypothetical protein
MEQRVDADCWAKKSEPWLRGAFRTTKPIFGNCFDHGGDVGRISWYSERSSWSPWRAGMRTRSSWSLHCLVRQLSLALPLTAKLAFFATAIMKAHVATSPKYPTTVHYRGDGVFMVSGRNVSYKKRFRPENL